MPKKARIMALKTARIFFPSRTRLCGEHNYVKRPWMENLDGLNFLYTYNSQQIEEMVDLLRDVQGTEPENMSEICVGDLKNNTGLTREQISEILILTPSIEAATKSKEKAEKALKMYLMRMRKASTYIDIAKKFNFTAPTVSTHIETVRKKLCEEFVPVFLGFKNISREILLEHTTVQARRLYCPDNPNAVVLIWDGTYIFCEKSGNYKFQKQTFSGQKKRNLVKPMVCVCSDGYIVDVFGPYMATENDASIMKNIMVKHPEVLNALQPFDVIVVDRGFRDIVSYLESLKFIVKIPEFADAAKPNAPLTNQKANNSRMVTKIRWVVETRNAHLKKIWSLFSARWTCRGLLTLQADIRIAAALINTFFGKLVADKYNSGEVSAKMLEKSNEKKTNFHSIIQLDTFQRKKKSFVTIKSDFRFPILSKDDMNCISLGTYQIREARRYIVEHMKTSRNHTYICFVCPSNILETFFAKIIAQKNIIEPALVLTQLSSRFRSKKAYDSFILADASKNGPDSIIAYYCECKHGLRTIGCCSHIMSTIFYLCYGRHSGDFKPVAPYLDNFFDLPSQDDSEDELI